MPACYQIDDVRNFLFGEPGDGAMDLVSLNLQRGRDHGIIHFNGLREALGLSPLTNFSEITSNENIALALETLYETVDDVDPWVGNLCEVPSASSLSHMFLVLAPDDRPLLLFPLRFRSCPGPHQRRGFLWQNSVHGLQDSVRAPPRWRPLLLPQRPQAHRSARHPRAHARRL